jgi:hypothetical protein
MDWKKLLLGKLPAWVNVLGWAVVLLLLAFIIYRAMV